MKYILGFYFLIIVVLAGCKPPSQKISELAIEEDKLVSLLADIHYATEASRINKMMDIDSLKTVYLDQLLQIHKLSKSDYESIMKYLNSNVDEYHEIEKKVHKYLKDLREEVDER